MRELKMPPKNPPFLCCLTILLLIILILQLMILPHSSCSSSLELTVATNEEIYYLGQVVTISGNLTLNGNPINNSIVGIEIQNPKKTIIMRVLPTGQSPQRNWLIEVIDVYPCDEYGNPKNSFSKGTLAYFNITVRNNDIEQRIVLITANIFDSNNSPIGLSTLETVIASNSTGTIIISVPIPEKAKEGTATIYANVFSAPPRIGGKPYGLEKSNQFQITSSSSTSTYSTENNQTLNGNFTTDFYLAPYFDVGNYTIYVTSTYLHYTATNKTSFTVLVPGDANGDFRVDLGDLSLLGASWYAKPGDPNWNPKCDFDQNGIIDVVDLSILGSYWGYPF